MTARLVLMFGALPLLLGSVGACASGDDAPFTPTTSTGVSPVTPGVTPAGSTSATGSSGTTSAPTGSSSSTAPGDATGRFGNPVMGGTGTSTDQYKKTDVTRDGQNYYLMANGWGPGWESHSLQWEGTSFTVQSLEGVQGPEYQPATYPTVFCGIYSDSKSKECGLPAELAAITSLRTGWSWSPAAAGSNEEYNAAYDIWLATGPARTDFSGFFMVWLREPLGQQPAGSRKETAQTVANVPGTWDIWTGEVNRAPIINYVRAEGQDTLSLEFDALDFIRDAQAKGYEVPGTHVLSVAVGFEIWNGPTTNLTSHDFYVTVE